jgi:ankyrin repeat protein
MKRKRKRLHLYSDDDEDEDEDEDKIMYEKINPIINLCKQGKYEELWRLFKDDTHPYGINEIDLETGMNGLMFAAKYGFKKVCRLLICKGIKLNVRDQNNNTELHHAMMSNVPDLNVIKTMVRYGSCRFLQNKIGQMPFTIELNKQINDFIKNEPMTVYEAVIMRDYDIVKNYFENDGYLPSHKDNSGRSLMQLLQEVEGKRKDVTKLSKLMFEYL